MAAKRKEKYLFALTMLTRVVSVFIVAATPAAMWFTCDDVLAELFGVPLLGQLGFWQAYGVAWIWSYTFLPFLRFHKEVLT